MGWTVNGGQLVVEGRLGGQGLVTAAGRLGGAGIVGDFVNQGTVAPGNSIGTLTVLGNYEHAAGAVLEIEGAINGESDRLLVNGRAQLNGGRVAVTPESRTYGIATEYTILNATGGVSGTFGSASSSQNHLDPYLDYGAQNVLLTLVRNDISFRQMGSTPNVQLLGSALDANKKAMARGDFKLLMDQFVFMNEQQRRTALDSLSGELHATIARTILHTGNRFFASAVDRQLSAEQIADKGKTVWTDAFGFTGSVDSDINASGASYRAAGFAAGMDFMVTSATRIGGAFGYAPGTTELSRFGGGEGQIRSYYPSLYGEHDAGRWSLGLGFGYGRHDVSTTRGIEVGPIARQATANYTADQYSGQVAGAFSLHGSDTVSVDAFGELRYSRLTRNSFDESGANSANLIDVSDGHSESLRSVLGMRTTWQPRAWSARVKPELRIGWARESLDYRGEFTATLDGATSLAGFQRFFVQGATEARDSAIISLGATTTFIKRGRMFFAYDGNFSSRGTEHGLGAGVRISW
jgi:outer membrane autotransporter protein